MNDSPNLPNRSLVDLLGAIAPDRPLTAVFHTAGILDDAMVDKLTIDQLHEVLAAKAAAAWHLHELTSAMPLSAFVLFSSMAGVIGNLGQAAYGAANAYLDALALHRTARGLPATAVAWGRWAGGGMGADNIAGQRQLDRRGLPTMPPKLAIQGLAQAVRDDRDAVVIGAIDWSRFAESVQTARPTNLFDRIPEATTATSTGMGARPASSDDALREQLGGLSVRERTRRLSDLVRTKIADLLGYRDRAELDLTRSFREIGFDSVLAVEFRNHLNKATNLVLPSSLVFDYPSPTQLVAHLTTYFEDHAPARSAVELTAATDAEVIQFISDQFGIT